MKTGPISNAPLLPVSSDGDGSDNAAANAVEATCSAAPGEASAPHFSLTHRALIIAIYVVTFWIALPSLLWKVGARFDAALLSPTPNSTLRALGVLGAGLSAMPLIQAMVALWRRGRGLPISHLPPTKLVATGLYRLVRHPIYVAFNVAWTMLALALGSWGAAVAGSLLLLACWVAYATVFEEPRLVQRFGSSYRHYAEVVPLLPLTRPVLEPLHRLWHWVRPVADALARHPVLFRGKHFTFVTYGAFVALGSIVMALLAAQGLRPLGMTEQRFFPFSTGLALTMVLGGRLMGLVYQKGELRAQPVAALRTVAFVSYGGYLSLLLYAVWAAPRLNVPLLGLLDRLVLPGLLCSAIGRLGCLSYGCCAGVKHPHGVCYTHPESKVLRVGGELAAGRRVPTQLLSSLLSLALVVVLLPIAQRALPAGLLAGSAAVLYGLTRATLDQTRDEATFGGAQLNRGQYAALGLSLAGLLTVLLTRAPVLPPVVVWNPESLLPALPAAIAVGLIVGLAMGIQGPRVGRW